MLTKEDFDQISSLVQKLLNPINNELHEFKNEFKNELKNELKLINKSIRALDKKIQFVSRFYDNEQIELEKRVTRIENHIGI